MSKGCESYHCGLRNGVHVQVFEIVTAASKLANDQVSIEVSRWIAQLNWPGYDFATDIFLSCSQSSQKNTSAHIRKANNLVIFQDDTVLLISEREAERILRALRGVPARDFSACLVNLAMCRWTATRPRQSISLAVGQLPKSLDGDSMHMAIVAVQLFNGETKFEYAPNSGSTELDSDTSIETSQKRDAVVGILFGRTNGQISASQASRALVQLRGRGHDWERFRSAGRLHR